MSKYEDFSDPQFPVLGLNSAKYRPEKTPYLDTFCAVRIVTIIVLNQMGTLIQYNKYELVLTSTECSTFYGTNITG